MTAPHPAFAPLDAPTLVEASAGTGKTYTIITYFVRAIVEKGYSPKQILVVTYTKAATSDLRARARARIVEALNRLDGGVNEPDLLDELLSSASMRFGRARVEERLRNALASIDQAAIMTIHGFCQRLLQDHPLTFGIDFDFEVIEDLSSFHAELAKDFWTSELYAQPEWLVEVLHDQGVTAQSLARLADEAMMPGVGVVGPAPVEIDDAALKRALTLQAEAGALWKAHRDQVAELLLEYPGFKRNQYNVSRIEAKWIPELEALFQRQGLQRLPDFFPKLARGKMAIKVRHEEPPHAFFDACRALLDAHDELEPMRAFAAFDFRRRFLQYVCEQNERRKHDTGVLSFDDLLTTVHTRVVGDERAEKESAAQIIARDYPLALVDEFQDTDSVQYAIFRSVYGEGTAVYVGDPKQAIYAFRGADVFSYIAAAEDVRERQTLSTNRRSDPAMVSAVNTLFGRRDEAFLLDGIRFEPAHAHEREDRTTLAPAMELIFADEARLQGDLSAEVASMVANEIAHLLRSDAMIEGRAIAPGDIAVLCRSNAKAGQVTKALRGLNIPTSLDGDSSVLSTEVANSLFAVLEAALMPGDSPAVRRALLTPLLGVSPLDLTTMQDDVWTDWIARFQDWHETWKNHGIVRFIEDMLRTSGAEQRLASSPASRRELTDLLHVEELLMMGERQRQRDPVALMQWCRRLQDGSPEEGMVRSEDLQQRPDAEAGAVRVTTIHKSKGLEYGIVYCPFNWSDAGLWSSERSALKFHEDDRSIRIDLGSPDRPAHEQQAELERFSEALRLLYVGVTRAKYRCTLFWGRARGWNKSALGYLLHGRERADKPTQQDLRRDVEELVHSSGGVIGWREPHTDQSPPLEGARFDGGLDADAVIRTYDLAARIASFTSLTGHDEKTPGPRAALDAEELPSRLFMDLPGGTRTGLLLHSIMEHADFAKLESEETRREIETQLGAYGFSAKLATQVQADLVKVATTPLFTDVAKPRLLDLDPAHQLRELEFTLSARRARVADLARLLREHRAPAAAPGYPDRLRELHAPSLQSFLRGYIDLMFEWQGRWYVADYKSNTLPSYAPDELTEAMQQEHYVLQALLYSAAAQRYLRQRLPGYDPQTHWGGALFLFLRGMRGADSRLPGVFFDRSTPELLDAIDRWLGGHDGSR
jgi:exodeoxyribonuclease V beta subunit